MNRKDIILRILFAWNLLGFMVGAINTSHERNGDYNYQTHEKENIHTGCVYRSAAAFTNLEYIAACELYRKRFEKEGF